VTEGDVVQARRGRGVRARGAAVALGLGLGLAAATGAAGAQCAANGYAVSDGGGACLPALRDGAVAQVLHVCEDGRWQSRDTVCPDDYAHFCRIGPHAVPTGTVLLLGSGPQSVECRFPGTLHLVTGTAAPAQPTDAGSTGAQAPAPSTVVRRVQRHVAEATGAAGLCPGGACSGVPDAATRAAVTGFVVENLSVLSAEERARLGIAGAADPEAALAAASAIDLFPAFAEIFDVAP
jgi:hypothetical protein